MRSLRRSQPVSKIIWYLMVAVSLSTSFLTFQSHVVHGGRLFPSPPPYGHRQIPSQPNVLGPPSGRSGYTRPITPANYGSPPARQSKFSNLGSSIKSQAQKISSRLSRRNRGPTWPAPPPSNSRHHTQQNPAQFPYPQQYVSMNPVQNQMPNRNAYPQHPAAVYPSGPVELVGLPLKSQQPGQTQHTDQVMYQPVHENAPAPYPADHAQSTFNMRRHATEVVEHYNTPSLPSQTLEGPHHPYSEPSGSQPTFVQPIYHQPFVEEQLPLQPIEDGVHPSLNRQYESIDQPDIESTIEPQPDNIADYPEIISSTDAFDKTQPGEVLKMPNDEELVRREYPQPAFEPVTHDQENEGSMISNEPVVRRSFEPTEQTPSAEDLEILEPETPGDTVGRYTDGLDERPRKRRRRVNTTKRRHPMDNGEELKDRKRKHDQMDGVQSEATAYVGPLPNDNVTDNDITPNNDEDVGESAGPSEITHNIEHLEKLQTIPVEAEKVIEVSPVVPNNIQVENFEQGLNQPIPDEAAPPENTHLEADVHTELLNPVPEEPEKGGEIKGQPTNEYEPPETHAETLIDKEIKDTAENLVPDSEALPEERLTVIGDEPNITEPIEPIPTQGKDIGDPSGTNAELLHSVPPEANDTPPEIEEDSGIIKETSVPIDPSLIQTEKVEEISDPAEHQEEVSSHTPTPVDPTPETTAPTSPPHTPGQTENAPTESSVSNHSTNKQLEVPSHKADDEEEDRHEGKEGVDDGNGDENQPDVESEGGKGQHEGKEKSVIDEKEPIIIGTGSQEGISFPGAATPSVESLQPNAVPQEEPSTSLETADIIPGPTDSHSPSATVPTDDLLLIDPSLIQTEKVEEISDPAEHQEEVSSHTPTPVDPTPETTAPTSPPHTPSQAENTIDNFDQKLSEREPIETPEHVLESPTATEKIPETISENTEHNESPSTKQPVSDIESAEGLPSTQANSEQKGPIETDSVSSGQVLSIPAETAPISKGLEEGNPASNNPEGSSPASGGPVASSPAQSVPTETSAVDGNPRESSHLTRILSAASNPASSPSNGSKGEPVGSHTQPDGHGHGDKEDDEDGDDESDDDSDDDDDDDDDSDDDDDDDDDDDEDDEDEDGGGVGTKGGPNNGSKRAPSSRRNSRGIRSHPSSIASRNKGLSLTASIHGNHSGRQKSSLPNTNPLQDCRRCESRSKHPQSDNANHSNNSKPSRAVTYKEPIASNDSSVESKPRSTSPHPTNTQNSSSGSSPRAASGPSGSVSSGATSASSPSKVSNTSNAKSVSSGPYHSHSLSSNPPTTSQPSRSHPVNSPPLSTQQANSNPTEPGLMDDPGLQRAAELHPDAPPREQQEPPLSQNPASEGASPNLTEDINEHVANPPISHVPSASNREAGSENQPNSDQTNLDFNMEPSASNPIIESPHTHDLQEQEEGVGENEVVEDHNPPVSEHQAERENGSRSLGPIGNPVHDEDDPTAADEQTSSRSHDAHPQEDDNQVSTSQPPPNESLNSLSPRSSEGTSSSSSSPSSTPSSDDSESDQASVQSTPISSSVDVRGLTSDEVVDEISSNKSGDIGKPLSHLEGETQPQSSHSLPVDASEHHDTDSGIPEKNHELSSAPDAEPTPMSHFEDEHSPTSRHSVDQQEDGDEASSHQPLSNDSEPQNSSDSSSSGSSSSSSSPSSSSSSSSEDDDEVQSRFTGSVKSKHTDLPDEEVESAPHEENSDEAVPLEEHHKLSGEGETERYAHEVPESDTRASLGPSRASGVSSNSPSSTSPSFSSDDVRSSGEPYLVEPPEVDGNRWSDGHHSDPASSTENHEIDEDPAMNERSTTPTRQPNYPVSSSAPEPDTTSEEIKAELADRPLPPMLDQGDLEQAKDRVFAAGKTNTNRNRTTKLNHKQAIKDDDWNPKRELELLNEGKNPDEVSNDKLSGLKSKKILREKILPLGRKIPKERARIEPFLASAKKNPKLKQVHYNVKHR